MMKDEKTIAENEVEITPEMIDRNGVGVDFGDVGGRRAGRV